jgi:signal peptidase I
METTLHGCTGCTGDRVLVTKPPYWFADPQPGDVVVFQGPDTWEPETASDPPSNWFSGALLWVGRAIGVAPPADDDFVKRVIAVGGDTVACCDAKGRVTVNGVPLDEPYIYQNSLFTPGPNGEKRGFSGTGNVRTVHVPKGELFVMGDHRDDSSDSRINGTIPESKVIGRAFIRVWPVSRLGLLRVPKTFSHVSSAAFAAVPTLPPAEAAAAIVPVALIGRRRRRQRRAQRRMTLS